MPLTVPSLDDRRYQDLLDEALARIPVHNPEWTNFNQQRPRRHPDRALRVPDREPALPRQPDPGAQPPQVPVAARHSACSPRVGPRAGDVRQRARAAADASRSPRISRCAPARCRSGPSRASTCCRSRRALLQAALPDPPEAAARALQTSSTRRSADSRRAGPAALRDGAVPARRSASAARSGVRDTSTARSGSRC